MIHFLQDDLCIKNPDTKLLEDAELILYIKSKLLRPLRVCGMVKNVGEPGGGPFLAVNPDGTVSLQVLESSQIDMSDPAKKAMLRRVLTLIPWIWFAPLRITRERNTTCRIMWIRIRASSLIRARMAAN